jgi:hypothetical protein
VSAHATESALIAAVFFVILFVVIDSTCPFHWVGRWDSRCFEAICKA